MARLPVATEGAARVDAGLDRPWRHHRGAARYGLGRLVGMMRPPVTITAPSPDLRIRHGVPIRVRDGTVLRASVYTRGDGPAPAIVCAQPYGTARPQRRRGGGWRPDLQYRMLRQPAPISLSSETGWEAPDPDWWCAQGYAVMNVELRGTGSSGGTAQLLSAQEGLDLHDVIEWAAAQRWCTGRVGMLGVSYLAMSQYRAAATRPPSLAAIVPWEGLTDPYRDLMSPGGVVEHGFSRLWARGLRRTAPTAPDLTAGRRRHPLRDDWWRAMTPDLAAIEVPMLVCASFSDNNLHSRGSFRALEHVASAERIGYTHRGGKWSTFYSDQARAAQLAFLDRHLKGADVAAPAPVRLEVRESGEKIHVVRDETRWPPVGVRWTRLYLAGDGRLSVEAAPAASVSFPTRRRAARFDHVFAEDTEISGPMSLDLWVSAADLDDVCLFAGVEKWHEGRFVGFEGSYGYGRDRVSTGWQRVSLRELDAAASTEAQPVHTFTRRQPLSPGEVVPLRVALGPSATFFRAGDVLRLVVGGRGLSPRNPLTGHALAWYEWSRRGTATLHWGPARPASLLVPVVPG